MNAGVVEKILALPKDQAAELLQSQASQVQEIAEGQQAEISRLRRRVKELEDQRSALDCWVLEVEPIKGPKKYVTIGMLAEDPERFAFERCTESVFNNRCQQLEPHDGHGRRA